MPAKTRTARRGTVRCRLPIFLLWRLLFVYPKPATPFLPYHEAAWPTHSIPPVFTHFLFIYYLCYSMLCSKCLPMTQHARSKSDSSLGHKYQPFALNQWNIWFVCNVCPKEDWSRSIKRHGTEDATSNWTSGAMSCAQRQGLILDSNWHRIHSHIEE